MRAVVISLSALALAAMGLTAAEARVVHHHHVVIVHHHHVVVHHHIVVRHHR